MTWTIRGPAALGLVTVVLLFLGIGVWGSWASLAGAVVAHGQLQIEERSQVVQHPDGGVVEKILVRDGDSVRKGDALVSLNGEDLTSRQKIFSGQRDELLARAARLAAERDGAAAITFPAPLAARAVSDEALARILDGQTSLFRARLATVQDATRSYDEQKKQIGNEIDGQKAQIAALREQIALLAGELATAQTLLDKGLSQASRALALRRENARLAGLKGETEAAVARNYGRIAQIDIEVLGLTAKRREEAVTELRDVEGRIAELTEEVKATEAKLARLVLTAPVSGLVHDLRIHSLGAVVRPAEPVLFIVPQEEELTVTAKIDGSHIDSVYAGQGAVLRFSAFNARTTPEITATVLRISADVTTDERTGVQFYTTELRADPEQVARLGGQRLLPGMPVEVFIQTGDRSPLSYLLKPFSDYFERAFRE